MISFLTGTVHDIDRTSITLLTQGGAGYAVIVTASHATELRVGDSCALYTYLKVSDSAMDLYGFRSVEDRSFFSLLLTVSGVGPKSAMNILAVGSVSAIQDAIVRGDATYLSSVQGIGKKTAERMVVELKNKISGYTSSASAPTMSGDSLEEIVDALVAMGYGKDDVLPVVRGLDPTGVSTEGLLREALKKLAR